MRRRFADWLNEIVVVHPPKGDFDLEGMADNLTAIVEGAIIYSVDRESRELKPGDWMSTPRGSVHGFRNTGAQAARALVVLTPDIGAQYFRDVAAVANAGGPPDRAKLVEVMTRYGLSLAAPAAPASA